MALRLRLPSPLPLGHKVTNTALIVAEAFADGKLHFGVQIYRFITEYVLCRFSLVTRTLSAMARQIWITKMGQEPRYSMWSTHRNNDALVISLGRARTWKNLNQTRCHWSKHFNLMISRNDTQWSYATFLSVFLRWQHLLCSWQETAHIVTHGRKKSLRPAAKFWKYFLTPPPVSTHPPSNLHRITKLGKKNRTFADNC